MQLMIYRFNFITMQNDINGLVAKANPALWKNDNLLTSVTVIPRVFVIAMLMIGWILSPIDIIPDAVPILGGI